MNAIDPPQPDTLAPCPIGQNKAQIIVMVFSGGEETDFQKAENVMTCSCPFFTCQLNHQLPWRVKLCLNLDGSFTS